MGVLAQALGEFEQLILFALLSLPEDQRYGVVIRDAIEQRTGRTLSTGAVYTALDRLSDKGLITSRVGEPTPERGGRRKRIYHLEAKGATALARSVKLFQDMSKGLLPRLETLVAHGEPKPGKGGR